MQNHRRLLETILFPVAAALPLFGATAHAQTNKPNIVVIFADDVGPVERQCLSSRHDGRAHAQHRPDRQRGRAVHRLLCAAVLTAGRAAFITGQHPFRTGLLRAGLPAAKQGIQEKDPTIAELLKPHGYATSQIGKNHLGDRNEYLPTVHGFDEFYGYLYHLNAMEEPEDPDFPKNPEFLGKFGARNVVDSMASEKDDATEDPRFGRVGKQIIKDAGPLTR